MSSNAWGKPIARLRDLRDGSITRIERELGACVLVRDGDGVYALGATCPHAGAPLEQGALCSGRLVCPWHKATFDIRSGDLIEPPALEGLAHYAVRVEGDDVYVASSPEPAAQTNPSTVTVDDTSRRKTMAIIGAGAAGAAACATLREVGFSGRIVLIDVETTRPYDRTALSKFVPSGELKPDDVYPLLPDDFLTRRGIEGMNRRVVRLDPKAREIEFSEGPTLQYDAALIATGSEPVWPAIEGLADDAVREHVVFLRSLTDARELDRLAADAKQALVVGGSFIGLETASALRKRGVEVTVVMPHALPFVKQFGKAVAQRIKQLHEANGTQFRVQTTVASLACRGGQVTAHLASAREEDCGVDAGSLEADFVVIGTGVKPRTDFVKGIVVNRDGGIDVDASMRVSSTLFAAGDVAAFPLSEGERTRIEHWRVAQQHARIAALNMAGLNVAPSIVPFFWTYHYGKRFDYLGHATSVDQLKSVILGSLEALEFIALYVRDDHVIVALGCEKEAPMAWLAERMRDPLPVDDAKSMLESHFGISEQTTA